MCAQRKAGRRQRASPAVFTLPMVPCGSSPVTRVSRSPLPCEKRSAWGGGWSRNASRNCFWDCYSGRAGQLLFKFFPCPRSLCKKQLVLETVNPFEMKFNNELTIVTSLFCTSSVFQCTKQRQNDSKNRNGHTGNNPILHNSWCACNLNKRDLMSDRVTIRSIVFTAKVRFNLRNFLNEKWVDKNSLKQLLWIELAWIYRFVILNSKR